MAQRRIVLEYKNYLKESTICYSRSLNDNIYESDIILFGPPGTIFEYAIIECKITFSRNYPYSPPNFIFLKKFLHPNVFPTGEMCISILRDSNIDTVTDIPCNEKWSPSHSIDSLLLGIMSVLIEPNLNSIANVDGYILWRDDMDGYKKHISDTLM